MTILTSIHEIFSDIRHVLHEDNFLMASPIYFDNHSIGFRYFRIRPTQKSYLNSDFAINEELAETWGRVSEKYNTYEPEKHVAF
jgi:hypothetical protein